VPPAIAIVANYHQIQPHERQRFARQLDHLCKWVRPIRANPEQPLPSGTRYVAITFDDGWRSFAEIAFPELKQRNIPVTLFVIAGRLGCKLEPQTDEPLISEAQLQSLAAEGVTIGSHTLTLCPLTTADDAKAVYELRESRSVLSELLEREVTLFAFPFGLWNHRLLDLCREAGYRRVFTGLPYLAYSSPEEFETGRVRVDPTDWPLEFHLKIMGAYCWLPAAFELKRQLFRVTHLLVERSRSLAAMLRILPPTLPGRDCELDHRSRGQQQGKPCNSADEFATQPLTSHGGNDHEARY
jgi:Polysaccharide deacetylase